MLPWNICWPGASFDSKLELTESKMAKTWLPNRVLTRSSLKLATLLAERSGSCERSYTYSRRRKIVCMCMCKQVKKQYFGQRYRKISCKHHGAHSAVRQRRIKTHTLTLQNKSSDLFVYTSTLKQSY